MKTNLNLLALGILLSLTGASFGQPVITPQPQSSTNAAGTTATFWVAATGTPPLAYQWQKLSGTTDLIVRDLTDFPPDATPPVSLPLDGPAGFYRIIGR